MSKRCYLSSSAVWEGDPILVLYTPHLYSDGHFCSYSSSCTYCSSCTYSSSFTGFFFLCWHNLLSDHLPCHRVIGGNINSSSINSFRPNRRLGKQFGVIIRVCHKNVNFSVFFYQDVIRLKHQVSSKQ